MVIVQEENTYTPPDSLLMPHPEMPHQIAAVNRSLKRPSPPTCLSSTTKLSPPTSLRSHTDPETHTGRVSSSPLQSPRSPQGESAPRPRSPPCGGSLYPHSGARTIYSQHSPPGSYASSGVTTSERGPSATYPQIAPRQPPPPATAPPQIAADESVSSYPKVGGYKTERSTAGEAQGGSYGCRPTAASENLTSIQPEPLLESAQRLKMEVCFLF